MKVKNEGPSTLCYSLWKASDHPLYGYSEAWAEADDLNLAITGWNFFILLTTLRIFNETILGVVPNPTDSSRVAVDIKHQNIVVVFFKKRRLFERLLLRERWSPYNYAHFAYFNQLLLYSKLHGSELIELLIFLSTNLLFWSSNESNSSSKFLVLVIVLIIPMQA